MLFDINVIQTVQPLLFTLNALLREVIRLVLNQPTHTIPNFNQPLYTALGGPGYLRRLHHTIFTEVKPLIHKGIKKITHLR